MKKRVFFLICLSFCFSLLAGCGCRHVWTEADCTNPKTCTSCHITEGEPLGHTPGQWQDITDVVNGAVIREQHRSVCGELTASETVPLSSMVADDRFLFTPNEFLARLASLADHCIDDFSYEFVPASTGLMAYAYCNGNRAIIQFFRPDTTTLSGEEADAAEVWCVSLITVGESDADLRCCFFMACDPALNQDTAFETDIHLASALLNASLAGEFFGYYRNNGLLYESGYISESTLAEGTSLSMVNIYASDFR